MLIFILDNSFKLKGVCNDYFEDIHIQRLDGSTELTFSVLVKKEDINIYSPLDELIVNNNIVYKDYNNNQYLLQILETTEKAENDGVVKTIYAENLGVIELSKVVKPPRNWQVDSLDDDGLRGSYHEITTYTANDELFEILLNTGWTYGGYTDVRLSQLGYPFLADSYETAYEQLVNLVNYFNLELEFKVEFNNGKIQNKYVFIHSNRNNNQLVFTNQNLSDVSRIIDTSDMISTVIPIGSADQQTNIQLKIDNVDDTNQDIVDALAVFDGDFVLDKTNSRIYSKQALNFFNGQHRTAIYENNDIGQEGTVIANELVGLTLFGIQHLYQNYQPRIEYTLKIHNLSEYLEQNDFKPLNIGDELIVIDKSFSPELRIKSRVVELKTSNSDSSKNEIIIGNVREIFKSQSIAMKQIEKRAKRLQMSKVNGFMNFTITSQSTYDALNEADIDPNTIYYTYDGGA